MIDLLLSILLSQAHVCGNVEVRPGMWHVYPLMQEEAERNLHHLAVVSDKEDSWTHDGIALIDTGYEEKEFKVSYDTAEVAEYFYNSPPAEGNINDYHIHPLHLRSVGDISAPSMDDITTHAKLKKCMAEQGVKARSHVLDGCGIWTYDAADEVLDVLSDDSDATESAKAYVEGELNRSKEQTNDLQLPLEIKAEIYIDRVRGLGIFLSYRSIE